MLKRFLMVFGVVLMFGANAEAPKGQATYTLENGNVRIVVDQRLGGRVKSFVLKRDNSEQTIDQGVEGGFCAEILPANSYPGLLRDAACELTVVEPGSKVRLGCKLGTAEFPGLAFEKEYSITENSSSLRVALKADNTASTPMKFHLRAQHCVADGNSVYTWPTKGAVKVYRHEAEISKEEVVEPLDAGWLGRMGAASGNGLAMLFDSKQVKKAYSYFSMSSPISTIEWYYDPVEIPPGAAWRTEYTIVPVAGTEPIVAANKDFVVGLEPLAEDGKIKGVAVTSSATGATRKIDVPKFIFESAPVLPPPPEGFPTYAAVDFFPFGEYLKGNWDPGQLGDEKAAVARNLEIYRRNYQNTITLGGLTFPSYRFDEFKKEGVSWMAELAIKHGFRMIPKLETIIGNPKLGMTEQELLDDFQTRRRCDFDVIKEIFTKYSSHIIAYDIADEPKAATIPDYLRVQKIFRGIDPKHPAVPILNLTETQFLPYVPIYYGDQYATHYDSSNPWNVGAATRKVAERTKKPIWVMLQAFGDIKGAPGEWRLPTPAEIRLMTYGVVANGGKGIMFHGSYCPPCWRFNSHYVYTPINCWGVATDTWKAMGEAAKQITAVGPSLLQSDFKTSSSVDCAQIGSYNSIYKGPAVTVGILEQRNKLGSFMVLVNQDIENRQKGVLRINPPKPNGKLLFDLRDLDATPKPGNVEQPVELIPGDGHVFYYGPAAEGARIRAAVQGEHYQNEKAIYNIDFEVAKLNGVEAPEATSLEKAAAAAYGGGDYAGARQKILAARRTLAQEVGQDKALSSCLEDMRGTQALLSELSNTFQDNFDVVVPKETQKAAYMGIPRSGSIWLNKEDAQMQRFADDTAECFKEMTVLRNRVYGGEAKAVVQDFDKLLQTVTALHGKAIPYVKAKSGKE